MMSSNAWAFSGDRSLSARRLAEIWASEVTGNMTVSKADAPAVGRAIYNERIRNTLGPEDKGKVVVIDVNSGDYEIADNDLTATLCLHKRCPNSFTWAERVGHPAVYHLGSRYRSRGRGSQPRD